MGKQINFYMDRMDEKEFFEHLLATDIKVVVGERCRSGEFLIIDKSEDLYRIPYTINNIRVYLFNKKISEKLISKYYSEINYYYVDTNTLAIELNRCYVSDKSEIKEGRLYLDTNSWNYYGLDKSKIKQMTKWYNQLERWIKKRYKKISNDFRYVGPHTLEEVKKGKLKLISHEPVVFYRTDVGETGNMYDRKVDEIEGTCYIEEI